MPRLHESLIDKSAGGIDLHERFDWIRKEAKGWLAPLSKNGHGHSERLEGYLDKLTANLSLTPQETFVLLCAAYMHDLGYWYDGKEISDGHPERSRQKVLNDWKSLGFEGFPEHAGNPPRIAEAVAELCHAHAPETVYPLSRASETFEDAVTGTMNLRKLAALLRLADETDDLYLRVPEHYVKIRSESVDARIDGHTITWHWDGTKTEVAESLKKLRHYKKHTLKTAREYLYKQTGEYWQIDTVPDVDYYRPLMLPEVVPYFTGRDSERKKIKKKADELRAQGRKGLVAAFHATGGMGKTELVKKYINEHASDYEDGVFWVSFKDGDWKYNATQVLKELLPENCLPALADETQAKNEVAKALSGLDALLVLDNIEDPAQPINPDCYVIITSREKQYVYAYGLFPEDVSRRLKPLDDRHGLSLLKDLCKRAKAEADASKRIVELLGGMPLAIEIAAATLNRAPGTASFTDYIVKFRDNLESLKMEEGLSEEDQERFNVRKSLILSTQALGELEDGEELVRLFEAVAVTAEASFSHKTLLASAGITADLKGESLVWELHERSLLEFDDKSKRYSSHPLLRQLATEMLSQDEEAGKLVFNHMNHFLDFVRVNRNEPMALIDERSGIWQAMVQTIQLHRDEELMPRFIEVLSTAWQKHVDAGEFDQAFRYLIATNLINIHDLGQSAALVGLLSPLHEHLEKLEEPQQGQVLTILGIALHTLGDYRKAIGLFEQALEIERKTGDISWEGAALGNTGNAYVELKEYKKAIVLYKQCLEIHQKIGDTQGEGNDLANMGCAYRNLGEYRKAIDLYGQALEIARKIGDIRGEGKALGNMGVAYNYLGEYQKAIRLYEQRLEIARKIGDIQGEGNALGNMGSVYASMGEKEKARKSFEASLAIFEKLGLPHMVEKVKEMMEQAGF